MQVINLIKNEIIILLVEFFNKKLFNRSFRDINLLK